MRKFAVKWDIELGEIYLEHLLNLIHQGYFTESWDQITKHTLVASKVFVNELINLQYKSLNKHIYWKGIWKLR